MKNDRAKAGQQVPDHVDYWKSTRLSDYLGGPFADRSGGAIIFQEKDVEEATDITSQDPFILKDLLANKWIKEWIAEVL